MSGKYALIIGNTEYTDPGLAQLTAPGRDTEDFARVLEDQEICAFDQVNILLNQFSSTVIETIDEFFDQKKPDDLLVLYFSGHGVRDELGALYLAVKNTNRARLRSTAVKSDYIRDAMNQSRSKRQVVILDCCNSGAFSQGMKAEVGGTMGMVSAFEGYGRYVLTASDEIQFAWEGDKIIGETENSLFTHFLLKGLKGEADSDSDGRITVDELYDYAYEQISRLTPKQTPRKDASKQEGEIVLRQSMRIEDIKPVPLPDDLINEIEDLRPFVREAAVQRLEKILRGKNIGMARSAIEALEKIATDENTTRRVSQMATQLLESIRQAEQKAAEERRAKEEAERLAALKAEKEHLAQKKAEAERKAKEEAERLARAKAEREAAEREAARLKVEREATELAAREAAENAAKEKAEKEAAEREADRLKAEQEAAQEKAERDAAQKEEREAMKLAARKKAEREAKERVAVEQSKVTRPSRLTYGAIGVIIIVLALCGFAAIRFLPSVFGDLVTPAPTEPPVATSLGSTGATVTDTPALVSSFGTETIPLAELAPEIPWLPLDEKFIPSVYTYQFNVTIPPFDSRSVRTALAQAIDREAIVNLAKDLGYLQLLPATTFTHPNVLGRDLYGQVGFRFDPIAARTSLAAVGYPHGEGFPTITLVTSPAADHQAIANAVAVMWRDNLGINVEVQTIGNNFNEYIAHLRTDTPGLFRFGWAWDVNDPNNNMTTFLSESESNLTQFANAEYDRLVEEAAAEFRDPATRQLLYIQAERILCEQEVAIIPVFYYSGKR